ncbi:MAG: hypothetical protein GYB67_15435 [Chloroflexi bacterium]|nr:hypothetical protein [Chloroflexota bacterium]
MPVNVYWRDTEQTIMCFDCIGRWTWKELIDATHTSYDMADSVPHRVDAVVNLTDGRYLPGGAFGQINTLARRGRDNWQLGVIVGANQVVKAMITMFKQLYSESGQHFVFAETVDDALALIAAQREQAHSATEAHDPRP